MIPFDAPSFITGLSLAAVLGIVGGVITWIKYLFNKMDTQITEHSKDINSAFDKIRQLERDKWDKLKGL